MTSMNLRKIMNIEFWEKKCFIMSKVRQIECEMISVNGRLFRNQKKKNEK